MRAHLLCSLTLCALACTGSVEDVSAVGTGGKGGSAGGAGHGGGTAGTGQAAACTVSPDVAPIQLRRLTEAEYNATVRDLFPGVALPKIDIVQEIDAKSGFENRASIQNPTALLIEQYDTNAAMVIAGKAVKSLSAVVPCAATEPTCGATFVETFGARAFRRPLTAAEKTTYTDFFNQQKTAISFNAAVQLTLEAFLQAPSFLYRVELGDPATVKDGRIRLTGYEMATRLSYLFLGSMPDAELFDAAKANKLSTPAQVEAQARRLLKDARLGSAMTEFHRQWLDFDRIDREATKDPMIYPNFTPALKDAIRAESDRFVEGVMTVGGAGSLQALLTSTSTFVNKDLAGLYGVAAPASGWAPTILKDSERAGFLTQANFLASHAHTISGSPPLRAVFLIRHMMCRALSPPGDADTTPPKPKPGDGPKTNRMLFEERTVGSCQGCHNVIDGIGYGLENYDAIGAYRTKDDGLDVDASGEIKWTDAAGPFTGGIELSQRLAGSTDIRRCMLGQWYEYALARDMDASDECKVSALDKALAGANGDVREMLIALTKSNEFMYRRAP